MESWDYSCLLPNSTQKALVLELKHKKLNETYQEPFNRFTHFNQENHTLEDLKVAVLKAGLSNQESRKKKSS